MGKSIRNPKYAPVIGTVFTELFHFNKLYDYQTQVAKTCPTFRILTPDQSDIHTTDLGNIEHILKTKFDKYTKGKETQGLAADLFGQGIFFVDGEKWRQQRKLASFEFSTRVLRNFSCAVFRKNAANLARTIWQFSVINQAFYVQLSDLKPMLLDLLMRCTLDYIFKVGFGVDLKRLQGSSKEGSVFIKAFDDSAALTYWRFVDPFWKLKRFLSIGSEVSLKKNIKLIDDFVHGLISTKRKQFSVQQENNGKEDIISRFLVESKKDPDRMNDKYPRDIILNFMIAGKDTSANTFSWFFYMICKNPLIQEKVAQEVEEVTCSQGDGARVDDIVTNITDEVLDKMHYLHSALTETMRLFPAVPVDGRCAEMDDILPDGFEVKKGDAVYYMAYAMSRMPYIWGDDAEDFKPERWLNNGIFQPKSPFKFTAFHAGPRTCLGKEFAYRQMKIVSTALLKFFWFKLADEVEKVTYRTMFTLHIKGGLHLCAFPITGFSNTGM